MENMCFEKEQENNNNKAEKGNEETHYLFKQHCIGTNLNKSIRTLIVIGFLIWNTILVVQLIETLVENQYYFSQIPTLYNQITSSSDENNLFIVAFGSGTNIPCNSCNNLVSYFNDYRHKMQNIVKQQGAVQKSYDSKAVIILLDQIVKLLFVGLFYYKYGIKTSQIYVSLYGLLSSSSFHSEEMSHHFVKFSTVNKKTKKNIHQIMLTWNVIFPFAFIYTIATFAVDFSNVCLNTDEYLAVTQKLIDLINTVLLETGKTEQYLFGYNVIWSVNYLQDTLLSCSSTNIIKIIFKDVFSAISFGQMAYDILNDLWRIITLTYLKKSFVSHYTCKQINSIDYLVAVPNLQPKKQILFSSTGKKSPYSIET